MFQFSGCCFTYPMYSDMDNIRLRMLGFPIRKSPGQSVFAATRGLSQLVTSFIALHRQGIHQLPLVHLYNSYKWIAVGFIPDEWRLCHPLDVKLSKNIRVFRFPLPKWWAQVDLNHRPPRYQHGALTNWAMSPIDIHGRMISIGGARRDRTDDLLNANQALFQLSYGP